MHAFLFVGQGIINNQLPITNLANKLHAKIMDFPLNKIEDVRNLNNLLRLSFSEPTLVVSHDIDQATTEALNAFLKNLEEPQENIYFALTAPSVRKVLPTIVSRCQIIKSTNNQITKLTNEEEIKQFLEIPPSKKLSFFDTIKDRNRAIEFIDSLIYFLHKKKDFTNMELLIKTRTCLNANGNVNLHLLNLVTHYA